MRLHSSQITGSLAVSGSTTAAGFTTEGNISGSVSQAIQTGITTTANLTTVGTISSGTWQGTTIAVNQGGTGVTTKTGTGNVVLSSSPTLTTPALGTPSAAVLTNATALPAAQVSQGTMASGMVLVAPALGTPASGTATNITGLPIVAGTTGTLSVARGGTGATSLSDLITLTTHTTGNYVATITGGTSITSTAATSGEGTTHSLSVDDVFVRNDGNDTSSGTITAGGFTTTATGSIAYVKASDEISGSISQAIQTGITTTANLTTVGALDAGSITSNFGTINNGTSTITTTGLISGGSLDIDDVVINGTTIGHTDDSDLLTVADGKLTVAGNLDVMGTTTFISSSQVEIGDRILELNAGMAAGDGGLYVRDEDTAETGSLLWDVSEDRWVGGLKDAEVNLVTISSTDTLTNKTLTTPTIGSFANATHTHANAAGGGVIALGTATSGNYVGTITGGTGITSTAATSGEGTTHSLSVDAAQTQITSVGTLTGLSVDGGTSSLNRGNSSGDILDVRGQNTSQMKVTTTAFTVTPNATFAGDVTLSSGSYSGKLSIDGSGYTTLESLGDRSVNIRSTRGINFWCDYNNIEALDLAWDTGNATFAGEVTTTGWNVDKSGTKLYKSEGSGAVSDYYIYHNTDYSGGTDATTSYIKFHQDGASSRKGQIEFGVGDNASPATALTIWNNSSATFAGSLTVEGAGIDIANGGYISSQDSGAGSIKLFGGGTNKGGYIDLRGGGNSGDMRVYTGTSGDGTLALTIDSSQNATFSDKVEVGGAITQSGAGSGKFVRKIHQANGTFSGDLIIYCTSTSWKSVIYDVTIAGHSGNGHWHGMFYWNSSGGDHNRSVAHYAGGVGDLGLGAYAGGSGNQGFKLQADLTSVTHPIVIVELTAGGGDTIPESDISINLS
jgi:hypothetical protein